MANTEKKWEGVGIHVTRDEIGNITVDGEAWQRIGPDLNDWEGVRRAEKAIKKIVARRPQPRYRGENYKSRTFAEPIHVQSGDFEEKMGIASVSN